MRTHLILVLTLVFHFLTKRELGPAEGSRGFQDAGGADQDPTEPE